jgi:integrase
MVCRRSGLPNQVRFLPGPPRADGSYRIRRIAFRHEADALNSLSIQHTARSAPNTSAQSGSGPAKLSLKDRLILELDMTVALRPSELFGLRWRDFNYDECRMELRFLGKIRNWRKIRKALRPVHIPKELAEDLWLWRHESKNP